MSEETVREVCAEIRLQTYQTMYRTSDVIGWRDRIFAAHEREMAAKDGEIARLKAALRPVMNACAEDAKCDAVREAQRIMKEGIEK